MRPSTLSLVVLTLVASACEVHRSDGKGADSGASSNEGDADTDADADSDTDADADADADSDVDYTVCADGTAPFTDIQEAIQAAAPGELIRVCGGVYSKIEVVEGVDVSLVGDGYETTTISGGSETAVDVQGGSLSLTGFSVRGTGTSDDGAKGGAFNLDEGSLVVREVRVDGAGGYAITLVKAGSLDIEGTLYEDNTTTYPGHLFYLTGETSVRFVHNLVRDSSVGSVWAAMQADVEANNNIFANIEFLGSTAFGLDTSYGGDQEYVNNVIYNIDAINPSTSGVSYHNGVDFRNSIIVGCNGTAYRPQGQYSLFYDNGAEGLGSNNLTSEPRFTDATAGDFTLIYGSSLAVDAGDPTTAYNDPDSSRNDMGAFGGPQGAWTP